MSRSCGQEQGEGVESGKRGQHVCFSEKRNVVSVVSKKSKTSLLSEKRAVNTGMDGHLLPD